MIRGLIPPSLCGQGGSVIDSALLVEELFKVDRSLSLTILATGLGLSPLLIGGTKELQTEFLKPFLSGEGAPLASLVHSEPEGTANWLEKGGKGLRTTARKEGDEWILNGDKARKLREKDFDSIKLIEEIRCGQPIAVDGTIKVLTSSALFAAFLRMESRKIRVRIQRIV